MSLTAFIGRCPHCGHDHGENILFDVARGELTPAQQEQLNEQFANYAKQKPHLYGGCDEITTLREQVEKLTEAYDQSGRTVQDYGRTIDQTESRLREVATHCANVEEQLAAIAEQNAKMRKALTKWRYLDSSYNWRCGHCGNEVEDGHKEGCALSLPDLASPVLNRIRAEGMRMAADICSEKHSLSGAEEAIRARAAELEKTND